MTTAAAHTDVTLRVSLLAQCQYDCGYCRPGAVTPPVAKARWLTPPEYRRLAACFRELGVRKVRFTGGEPLLRPDLAEIVAAFRSQLPGVELALTTNGQRLPARLDALVAAGLQRATVHVDSLRQDRYQRLMGAGSLRAVLAGVLSAQENLESVKLNVVVQRGENDDELLDFLGWSRVTGVQVRFIELMNTGSAAAYTRQVFLSGHEVLERLREHGLVRPLPRQHPADPAALYEFVGGPTFGLIASDTTPFCAACDRLRLSADGQLRGCLYQAGGAPLGEALRAGASEADLLSMMRLALRAKRSHHPATSVPAAARARFSMADTGG